MRFVLIFSLIVGINVSSFGCFCASLKLCKLLEITESDEKTMIFMGSYIQEESMSSWQNAFQFKVEKIYRGEVITPSSSYYNGEPYINTDSTAWLLAGASEGCLRTLSESKSIFIVTYNDFWPAHDSIGYVPTICRYDHFYVSEDQMVTGAWPGDDFTMGLAEFEEIITNGCTSTSTFDNTNSNKIEVYPNPIIDVVNIDLNKSEADWQIALYDTNGNKMKDIVSTDVDVSEFDPGVYFLVFTKGKMVRTKKIVKI